MVHMPAAAQGKDRKLARPFRGLYQILSATPTNVEVHLITSATRNKRTPHGWVTEEEVKAKSQSRCLHHLRKCSNPKRMPLSLVHPNLFDGQRIVRP